MSTIPVLEASGGKAGTVELPAEIFGVQVSVPLIHQVVVAQLAAARQGTHSTKSRGQVSGGGAKPYRQKGTGRARQGSLRAPQFAGGGVVHGPTPRDYAQRTPKKMKAAALRGALSDRAQHDRVHVVAGFVEGSTPSTKAALATLAKLTARPNVLVVVDRDDDVSVMSLRNAPQVHLLPVDQLNTYDVLCADDVVFTKAALEVFVARTPRGRVAEAAPEIESGEFGPDSAEPLADGAAPQGFTIKGNKNSMKYHLPDGRWYESTVAEVWFRTEDAAKAAGFVRAGTKAKEDGE